MYQSESHHYTPPPLLLTLSPHTHTSSHSVFYANQNRSTPSGHETLAFSVGGRPADLNQGGTPTFLTFKKGVLYGHNTAITGLGIIIPSKVGEGWEGTNISNTLVFIPPISLSPPPSSLLVG